ncbi:hypothetical protein [Thermosporothrix hazakensis]|jgi:hypothetical protein|nr:hypothetical protein [Thermosporothrix hazakensis]
MGLLQRLLKRASAGLISRYTIAAESEHAAGTNISAHFDGTMQD